jgi:hypothetical protein
VLRSVQIPASMRRMRKEGRLHMARVFWFSETRTLAGIPIRSIPFAYEFGVFEGGGIAHVPRARLLLRELEKPSTEVQTDVLGIQVAAMGVGAAALASAGMGAAEYLPVAGVAATVAALSAYEVARKLRFEKTYGDFFMASVVVASADLKDGDGLTIVRKGADEIAELHAVGHLAKMSELNRQGVAGRLEIILGALEGLRSMMDDMDDPAFRKVSYVTARSDLTVLLFKMGFDEVTDPPPYDVVNRTEKRALMWLVGKRVGRKRPGDAQSYRMAIASRDDFTGAKLKAGVDAQIERVRRDLDRLPETQRTD